MPWSDWMDGKMNLNYLKNYVETVNPGGISASTMRGFGHIEDVMKDLGSGATGIIACAKRGPFGLGGVPGHAFNVYVDASGIVRFADGQREPVLRGYSERLFLFTNR